MFGEIVGRITPSGEDGEPPLFEKIPRHFRRDPEECQHSGFKLDEKWGTVECGKCGARLDPFSVLLQYADWWDYFIREKRSKEAAEQNLHKEQARRLKRLRDCPDDAKAEIGRALNDWHRLDVKTTRALVRKVEKLVRERKRARREP